MGTVQLPIVIIIRWPLICWRFWRRRFNILRNRRLSNSKHIETIRKYNHRPFHSPWSLRDRYFSKHQHQFVEIFLRKHHPICPMTSTMVCYPILTSCLSTALILLLYFYCSHPQNILQHLSDGSLKFEAVDYRIVTKKQYKNRIQSPIIVLRHKNDLTTYLYNWIFSYKTMLWNQCTYLMHPSSFTLWIIGS